MEIKFEKTDNVHGLLSVSLAAADYADKVKDQLKTIAKRHNEPGFRPGKTPKAIIEKKFGKAVKYDVVNQELGEAVYNYIRENNLPVLGNPTPAPDNTFDIEGTDYEMKFIVGLSPEIDTHVNKDMHIPYYKIEVSDKMIDEQSDALRRRFGKQVPGDEMEPNALVKGVITELDADGKAREGGIVVENGIVSPQYFKSDDQKKLFEGKKPGDTVVFNPWATCEGNATELSSMLNVDKDQTENYKGDFSLEIKEIIVLRPAELDKELFDTVFGPDKVKNEEEWRKAIADMISAQLEGDSNYRFSIDAKDVIEKAVGDIELPDDVLKHFLKERNEAFNDENIDAEYEKALPSIKWEVVQEAIVKQFDIKLTEEEVKDLARVIARQQLAQYGVTNLPDETLDQYADNILKDERMAPNLHRQGLEMKIFRTVRDNVTVDDKSVSVEDFNKLFAPAE